VRARFEGRRALVTGGGSGIGLATARLLRGEGAAVALLDRNEDRVRRRAEETDSAAVVANVADPDAVAAAVGAAAEALGGPPDLVVNAAGIYRFGPALELSAEDWSEILDINLRGSFLVAREVAGRLCASGVGGSVVNIASVAALVADRVEPAAHYNASKAGVVAMTKQLAVEWAPYGIRVNAVCPGPIQTPMLSLADDAAVAARYLEEHVPLGRFGRPEEVAAVIAFLCSDEASYMTGSIVTVDGGLTAL
jgi:meso-butanediol dehydrogenase/(S,S)-butanediol dehydrogenase/diacetyl reductase